MKVEAWPFLISRNLDLDYSPIVVPDFIYKAKLSYLIDKAVIGNITDSNCVFYREIHNSKVSDITLIYHIVEATANDIGLDSNEILKDKFGRVIRITEGVVLKNRMPNIVLNYETLELSHRLVITHFREFWKLNSSINEFIVPSQSFSLETNVSLSSDLILEKKNPLILELESSDSFLQDIVETQCESAEQEKHKLVKKRLYNYKLVNQILLTLTIFFLIAIGFFTFTERMNKSITHKPSDYNNGGTAYYHKKEYNRAIADYNQALKLDPSFAPAYNNRGNVYKDLKEYDRAIADYNQALKLNPNYTDAYNNRGLAYYHKKEYDRAIADYNQALKLNPNYTDAYNNRGLAYYHKKEYDRAIADYNQALKLNPNYFYAYNGRGNVYKDLKDYDHAITEYNQSLKLDPSLALAYYNRGLAYKNKGSLDSASEDFKKVLELNDDVELSQKARQHLQELGIPPTQNQ